MANKGLRSLVILLGAALMAGLSGSAFAQAGGENKPPEPQNAEKSEAAHFAEVARAVTGAAAQPECIHLGENAVTLMAKNDLDTAQRHINLYDRFGCPGLHLRLTFRCLLNVGMPSQKDEKPTLESRVRECWINPAAVASAQAPPAAASTPPAPPAGAAPAPRPPAPATAGTGAR